MKKKTYLVPAASAALTITLFGVTAFATAVPKDPGLQGGTEASTEAVSETAPAASSGNAGADLAIDQPDVLAPITSQEEAKKALRMGAFHRKKIWTEPGITSFSTTIGVAEKFAQNKGSWGIVLICRNNKSAIPFRHMSLLPHEDEVISPGGHQNLEWKIDKKSMSVDKKKRIIYIDITEL